jgi:serine/threonine protein kinase
LGEEWAFVSSDDHTIGKYKLVNCIASGQATQIWEALDSETTRRVAMKLLLPEKLTDPEMISGIKNEFKVASSFDHPNIPKYLEIVANKKMAYFTMELFNAPNLKTQLYNDIRGVHIRLKRLVELVAMALEHIHERGWVHRDIKPDNILMNKSSEVRVIDFSLACRAASALSKMLHRKQATVQGTRTYMAPEQILGNQ